MNQSVPFYGFLFSTDSVLFYHAKCFTSHGAPFAAGESTFDFNIQPFFMGFDGPSIVIVVKQYGGASLFLMFIQIYHGDFSVFPLGDIRGRLQFIDSPENLC